MNKPNIVGDFGISAGIGTNFIRRLLYHHYTGEWVGYQCPLTNEYMPGGMYWDSKLNIFNVKEKPSNFMNIIENTKLILMANDLETYKYISLLGYTKTNCGVKHRNYHDNPSLDNLIDIKLFMKHIEKFNNKHGVYLNPSSPIGCNLWHLSSYQDIEDTIINELNTFYNQLDNQFHQAHKIAMQFKSDNPEYTIVDYKKKILEGNLTNTPLDNYRKEIEEYNELNQKLIIDPWTKLLL